MTAKQLVFDLLARDKTGPATKSSATNLKTVGDAAEDAAESAEHLGKESDRADEKVEGFGRSARTAAQHVDKLDREIESVEKELRGLAVAFTEAQTKAERTDLSAAIRRTERDLKQLNKSKGLLGGLIPKPAEMAPVVAKAGAEAGTGFIASMKESIDKTPIGPAVMAGVALSAIALSPAIGATIAAGILGAPAGGGVIGGLKLASRDARVKAAAKGLGEEVMDFLDESAGAFVPAALTGIEKIRGSFGRMSGDLDNIFENSARYVGPLVDGVTGLVEQALSGVSKAVAAAGPVIDVLKDNLPELGAIVGDMFESLADNGPEAAAALEQMFHFLEGSVVVIGGVINGLTEVYGLLAASGVLGDEAKETWTKYAIEAGVAEKQTKGLAGAQGILAEETLTAAEAAERETKAITELNKMLRAQADPLFAFGEAQDKVTASQKKYDEAVKKHGRNSTEAQAATRDLAGSFEDLNDAASKIPTTTDGKLTPAFRRMLSEGGASEAQIKDIERELGRLKNQADKYDGLNARAKFSADTGQAATRVGALLAQLSRVRSKRITVSVGVSGAGALAAIQTARILSGRAEGGPVDAGTPYIVGEKRPEVFVPKTAGTIVPSVGQFAGAGRGASRGSSGGGGWVVVRGDAIIDTLTQAIAARVSARGGRAAQLGIRFT